MSFVVVSIVFIPISLWVGQYKWTGWGPFDFQVNRLFLYLIFFLFGSSMGSGDWENHFFTNKKLFNKEWFFWSTICVACFVGLTMISIFGADIVQLATLSSTLGYFIFDLFFVGSCIASSFAFLAFFKQKIDKPSKLWTNFSANAFGIYLVHYVFVTWLQFALQNIFLPVILKFLIVFIGALLASWLISSFIKKI